MMDISVIVPLYNEAESLPELYAWIARVMQQHGYSYEVIFVNDGSTDNSWEVIESLAAQHPEVHGIKFRRNYGKSPALYCGFKQAQGEVVITMDADLQDSPDEIPELRRMIVEEGYDLVSGWKKKRYDPLSKTLPTKIFNATAPSPQVRKVEVWSQPLYQRLSGSAFPMVPEYLRRRADALFRSIGLPDIPFRLYRRCDSWCQQTILSDKWYPSSAGDQFALFLLGTDSHDYRCATVRGWFLRRVDFTKLHRAQ